MDRVKLKEMALLAEIVGAFAIVISLIYVGVQVHDSNRAVRSDSSNNANVAVQQWYLNIGSDTQSSRIFYKVLMSETPTSSEDEFQFMMNIHGAFLAFQNSYLMANEGTIDSELVESLTAAIQTVKDTPGVQRYWKQRRSTLHPRFANYVDELMEMDGITPVEIYRVNKSP